MGKISMGTFLVLVNIPYLWGILLVVVNIPQIGDVPRNPNPVLGGLKRDM
jgi:hypothetical protein